MPNNVTAPVFLVGAGPMAIEYAKVLIAQKIPFITIGRGEKSASIFKEKTGCEVKTGGLTLYLDKNSLIPEYCIVATGVESLVENTIELINAGAKYILCEKPGALYKKQLEYINQIAEEKSVTVFIAYNRRFYSSVIKAQEIIDQDGGITSFNFEFTEWTHVIEPLIKGEGVKERWFLSNSTHVADLAFYLGGKPKTINCQTSGSLNWHPSASNFSGSGVSETGALFCYQANWGAPGRWAVELLTEKHRLYLKPMEKLQIQNKGSVAIEDVQIDNKLDIEFKPGLYKMIEDFVHGRAAKFCSLQEQLMIFDLYCNIANYED